MKKTYPPNDSKLGDKAKRIKQTLWAIGFEADVKSMQIYNDDDALPAARLFFEKMGDSMDELRRLAGENKSSH